MTTIDMDALSAAARIALSDEEKQEFLADVEAILSLGAALTALDASADPEKAAEALHAAPLRSDEPAPSLARDAILAIAPSSAETFVTVPRILGDEPETEAHA